MTGSITPSRGWDIGLVVAIPLTRRAVVAGVGALGITITLTSCGSDQPAPIALDSGTDTQGDPEAASELQLIALYVATVAAFPELEAVASPIAEQHREHARALGASVDTPQESVSVADTIAAAIDQLIAAEQQAARARQDACAMATEGDRVRLLALIAASEASHVTELSAAARGSA